MSAALMTTTSTTSLAAPAATATASSATPSATAAARPSAALQRSERLGLLLGLVGVVSFSLTLPMTRLAVAELSPWLVAFGRMSLAGAIAAPRLLGARATRPPAAGLRVFAAPPLRVVVRFPLLFTLGTRNRPAHPRPPVAG